MRYPWSQKQRVLLVWLYIFMLRKRIKKLLKLLHAVTVFLQLSFFKADFHYLHLYKAVWYWKFYDAVCGAQKQYMSTCVVLERKSSILLLLLIRCTNFHGSIGAFVVLQHFCFRFCFNGFPMWYNVLIRFCCVMVSLMTTGQSIGSLPNKFRNFLF